jgi:hypothetical protein
VLPLLDQLSSKQLKTLDNASANAVPIIFYCCKEFIRWQNVKENLSYPSTPAITCERRAIEIVTNYGMHVTIILVP